MLFKHHNRSAIQAVILTSLLSLLASCGNSAALESLVSADPQLKIGQQSPASKSGTSRDSAAVKDNDTLSATPPSEAAAEVFDLPANFPASFPVYPQAKLQETKSEADNSGMVVWQTTDNREAVADYYQTELLANNWEIIKPFAINPEQKIARAIATKDNLRVEMTLLPSAANAESDSNNTQLSMIYHPLSQDIPKSGISQAINPAKNSRPDQNNQTKAQQPTQQEATSRPNNNADFTDLDEVAEQLQQPLESVAALGVLTPYTGEANVELSKFAPNEIITRGEYARWLITANNRYYSDNPSKKIYVATKTNQPAFQDVKPNDPDFAAIQSLAEAGLIPSRLTEDNTNLLFRPDAPLTREDLITWKVPLDTRQSLPQASIEAIQESWGFQDAENIDSAAVRALYADFQNGDRSNIRRIFGYTTLFQPKKPITRGEAAASLWYFGFQGDGITAREVLELETKSNS